MELDAAGVLVALAAAVLAAARRVRRAAPAALLVAFAVAAVVFRRVGLPPVDALAFCVGAALVAALLRPRWSLLPPLAAGVCGAAWASILAAQGLAWLPAVAAAAGLIGAAAVLAARRAGFTSAEVRDEALILVGAFALALAVGPAVVAGWRSAEALAAEPLGAAAPEVGPWFGVVVGSLLVGAAYSYWKRR